MRRAVIDTGPLVAFLDRAELHHPWVIERIDELQPPLLECEPVLAEAMHHARQVSSRTVCSDFLKMVRSGLRSASMSTFPPFASCIRNIEIGQCRSPTRVLYGWPKFTINMPCWPCASEGVAAIGLDLLEGGHYGSVGQIGFGSSY
jgi:hypothetical protein